MSILYLLIPVGVVLLAFAVWAFFWAVRNDQFDDLDHVSQRILYDDDLKNSASQPDGDE